MAFLSDFFSQKSLLVTGASGFVGQCLVEKILRTCPQVERVFIVLRAKSGKSVEKRLEEILENPLFDLIRCESAQQLTKVHALCGDVTQHELGLKPSDRNLVLQSVQIVFNCAATIRFDEPLRRALQLNVASVQRLLVLCEKCEHLEALVHVSTAYCTRDRDNVLEEIPREPFSPKQLLEALDWIPESSLEAMTSSLLRGLPSTYHLTKALAEQLLSEGNVPLAIVRPSIIVGSWKTPSKGWINNYNGISGFLVASGKGILRSMHCIPNSIVDVIPVDLVANTCLVSARAVSARRDAPLVVNCCSGERNGLTWQQLKDFSIDALNEFPSREIFRPPEVSLHASRLVHALHSLFGHKIPSLFVDFLFRLFALNPILTQVYSKLDRSLEALDVFTRFQWNFKTANLLALHQQLNPHDRMTFDLDPADINWRQFFGHYALGVRTHLLRETQDSLFVARRQVKRMRATIVALKALATIAFILVILRRMRNQ